MISSVPSDPFDVPADVAPLPASGAARDERVPTVLGGVVVGLGTVVLIGWATGTRLLVGLGSPGGRMLPNAALAFIMLGGGLVLLDRGERASALRAARAARVGATVLGLLVTLFAVAVITAIARGTRETWLDRLAFAGSVTAGRWAVPGRIALNSAIAFVLLGASVVAHGMAVPARRSWLTRVAHLGASLALLVAFLGFIGHIYEVQGLYRYGAMRGGMAFGSSITFSIAALGVLSVQPTRGFTALLRGDDAGGVLARRLVPAAIVVPMAFGWLWVNARRAGAVEREAGVALFVIGMTIVFLLLINAAARTVRAYGDEREELLTRERAARARAEAASHAAAHAIRQAEEARGDAEHANRAKSEFLATMSHELRTPLNAIAGYTELLAIGVRGPVTPEQVQDLERIRRAERHLLGLITDVLNFAKLEAGRLDIEPVAVVVADALRDVEAIVAPLVARKAQRLAFPALDATAPLVVRADREKLRQILLNLLSNAVKFSPEGSDIALRVESQDERAVAIRVVDGGPGIAEDQRERVFEPFVQLRADRTRAPSEGTGLGLSISRELARAMKGGLTVEPSVGGGATLVLTLPRIVSAGVVEEGLAVSAR